MSGSWKEQGERGSPALVRLMTKLVLRLGRKFGYALLFPICLYFLIFTKDRKTASLQYLRRVQGPDVGLVDVFRHFFLYAETLLDRPFLLAGRYEEFELVVEGMEVVDKLRRDNQGHILLGAHLGSFEAPRALAYKANAHVKALMHVENSEHLDAVFSAVGSDVRKNVIELGEPNSLLVAKAFLDSGGAIGLLADRDIHKDKLIEIDFLGDRARFPVGPFLLASVMRVPVVFFVALAKGNGKYEIFFEEFADRIDIERRSGIEKTKYWVGKYARRLEHYARQAPLNWFNFYDFWGAKSNAG